MLFVGRDKRFFSMDITLPETNSRGPLEKEIPNLETHHFRGFVAVSFREGKKNRQAGGFNW